MLRNLLDLLRAGALSTGLAIARLGQSVGQLTTALVARYGPDMRASPQSIRALHTRSVQAVQAAEQYLIRQSPLLGAIPRVPATHGESGFTTRITIRIDELDSSGNPTGVSRYHTTYVDSTGVHTGAELNRIGLDIAMSMDTNYRENIAFAHAVNRYTNPRITTRIDSVVRWV